MCIICVQIAYVSPVYVRVYPSERVSKHAGCTLTLKADIFLVYLRAFCVRVCSLGSCVYLAQVGVTWIWRILLTKPWGSVGSGEVRRDCYGVLSRRACGGVLGPSDHGLSSPTPQDNASKLLLALMESRHDSENAERILISLRPQELVSVGQAGGQVERSPLWGGAWAWGLGSSLPCATKRGHSNRHCPARWTSSRRPTCRRRSVRTQR